MIGKTISHYKILDKLGEGGMGVVYKAEDTDLKRTVALKFLPPHALGGEEEESRFIHEAQAAAALDHPSICTVHEINKAEGHTFIAMAYVEGQSLKERVESGPLKLGEVVDIAIQVAEGLQEAHEKVVVHRDIKPANIMITPKGQAKIMDFGLAKSARGTLLTQEGTTLGTVAYMSPEQARGEEVDSRTDIWSLGAILYEMVAGQRAFKGDYEPAVLYSILNQVQEPLTALRTGVPMELERILNKTLAKSPDERYQHASEMLVDLRQVRKRLETGTSKPQAAKKGVPPRKHAILYGGVVVVLALVAVGRYYFFPAKGEPIDSIAVLPLENLSNDPDQEYFADGMTDELIANLAQLGALRVISRTSAMRYKGSDKSLPEIARELNVGAIVEGTVMSAGNRVRITAQLIEAAADRNLWAKSYERDLRDVLALQSEVARAIVGEIRVAITPEEEARLASPRPVNPEAHELYLRGKHHYAALTKEGTEKSIECFQKAIEVDPNYARAYAALSASYSWLSAIGFLPPKETYSRCKALIDKALELDDTLAEAHMELAELKYEKEWDWPGADEEFKRAIELNPNLSENRCKYAVYLMAVGRFSEAIAQAERALQLDPLSSVAKWILALVYYGARQYERATAICLEMVELDPNDGLAYGVLADTYEAMGRYEDAVTARQVDLTLMGVEPEDVAELGRAYSESGPEGYWMGRLEILKGKEDRYPTFAAQFYARIGDKDKAFAWLERAYEDRHGLMFLLKVSPAWDPLRDDPRYEDLVRRMNFPE